MSAQGDFSAGADQENSKSNRFQVNRTLWGYVLISDAVSEAPKGFVSMIGKSLGVFFFLALIGLWFMPRSLAGADIFSFKLVLSALYIALGSVLLFRGRPVLRREVQVNLQRGELSTGIRNKSGEFHLEGTHAFDDIDVVSFWTDPEDADTATVFLRLGGSDIAIIAAHGEAALVAPYRIQLAKDLGAFAGGVNPVASSMNTKTPLLLGPRIEVSGLAA